MSTPSIAPITQMIIIQVRRQGSPWCLPAIISAHLDQSLRQNRFNIDRFAKDSLNTTITGSGLWPQIKTTQVHIIFFFKEVRRRAAAGRAAEGITSVCDLLSKDFNPFSPPTISVAPVHPAFMCPGASAPITHISLPAIVYQ
ncbi:uncharacterized protein LOC101772382 [Setaria italica]|uniref:uncharacterized protein LOC101772382 n=1 Tax=Setaria italica TaxID=4555 RepID=UPI000BE5D428|nr:uncharacterized protein LOC101772382 [Setaria italica]